jgi:flavin-dependent dehydrogenase
VTGEVADLLVAGAGPVGLGVAIGARLAGLTVTVLDPRTGPIDKACGEGLMPTARVALERLGVQVDGLPFHGIRYLAGETSAEARFRHGPGLGVRRTALSTAMARRAEEVGVRRVAAAAPPPVVRGGLVHSAGERAGWFVAADGLHSPTRAALALGAPGRRRGRPRYGLRRHYRIAPWADLVEVYWSDAAEAYVTPVAPDLVGVAVLCPGGRPYQAWLEDFPDLRERLAGAEPASDVRGAGPLRQDVTARARGRTLLVGDAAGYVDALTGEGISMGLTCARELVAALAGGHPQDYDAAWRRTTRRYRILTGGLLIVAGRPALRRTIVPAARALPALFAAIVNQLG